MVLSKGAEPPRAHLLPAWRTQSASGLPARPWLSRLPTHLGSSCLPLCPLFSTCRWGGALQRKHRAQNTPPSPEGCLVPTLPRGPAKALLFGRTFLLPRVLGLPATHRGLWAYRLRGLEGAIQAV